MSMKGRFQEANQKSKCFCKTNTMSSWSQWKDMTRFDV